MMHHIHSQHFIWVADHDNMQCVILDFLYMNAVRFEIMIGVNLITFPFAVRSHLGMIQNVTTPCKSCRQDKRRLRCSGNSCKLECRQYSEQYNCGYCDQSSQIWGASTRGAEVP